MVARLESAMVIAARPILGHFSCLLRALPYEADGLFPKAVPIRVRSHEHELPLPWTNTQVCAKPVACKESGPPAGDRVFVNAIAEFGKVRRQRRQ